MDPSFSAMIDSDEPTMPADGVTSCIVEPKALCDPKTPAVSMAISIDDGEAIPATAEQLRLLHVALVAAAQSPPVGAEPHGGSQYQAEFTVFDIEGAPPCHR